jgi:AcrR family transcriptional regulator
MKNKRQQAKQTTFEKIIKSAKKLIEENGILKLKTIDITKDANIAHGTLFAHFETKEILVAKVCQMELIRIAKKLKKIAERRTKIDVLIDNYLGLVAENEEFYIVIAKEFPFLDEKVQQSVLATETIIKNILYKKIEEGNKTRQYNVTDITMTIAFFFASINYYLSRKEYYTSGRGTLMSQKKDQISNTFIKLLNQ